MTRARGTRHSRDFGRGDRSSRYRDTRERTRDGDSYLFFVKRNEKRDGRRNEECTYSLPLRGIENCIAVCCVVVVLCCACRFVLPPRPWLCNVTRLLLDHFAKRGHSVYFARKLLTISACVVRYRLVSRRRYRYLSSCDSATFQPSLWTARRRNSRQCAAGLCETNNERSAS